MIQIHRFYDVAPEELDRAAKEEREIKARIAQELGQPPRCSIIDRNFLLRTFFSFINPWYDSGKALDRMWDEKEYDEKTRRLRYQLEHEAQQRRQS